jgi:hypothetical protein
VSLSNHASGAVLTVLVPWVCKNWKKSLLEVSKALEDFELLNDTATPEQRRLWQNQLDEAHANRAKDVTAMDILEVKIPKGKHTSSMIPDCP